MRQHFNGPMPSRRAAARFPANWPATCRSLPDRPPAQPAGRPATRARPPGRLPAQPPARCHQLATRSPAQPPAQLPGHSPSQQDLQFSFIASENRLLKRSAQIAHRVSSLAMFTQF